ncbi:endopeptidase La [Symbiobacterium thermophilum]|uniref:Lon protease n=2 Tax=Symbiobacterium thermophilum TaxID=2734 RepID=Q67SJ7_SYMTH|nr:endopeptidase La [Symbiobacterium thermophilum]MBY6275030.1 endopeptidase La [Symbiobacterium thermophilum]BAD39346.1 Lon protease [Symbiobacterium thermophilum IAM 14863]
MADKRTEQLLNLPLLPLKGQIVFPTMIVPLEVGREKSMRAVEAAMNEGRRMVLAMQKDAKNEMPTPDDIYLVGTIVEIKQVVKVPGGTLKVVFEGVARARIDHYVSEEPYMRAAVAQVPEPTTRSAEAEALMRMVISQYERYVKSAKKVPPESLVTAVQVEEPGRLADTIAAYMTNLDMKDKQAVLEAFDVVERLERISDILSREMEVLDLERKINVRVRKQMEKTQREYYLREQIKAIQKELGERDDRGTEAEQFREKIEKLGMPDEVKEKALREVDRFEKMPPMAAEAVVVRNYLEWLTSLPWSTFTEDQDDLKRAEEILESEHYGLKKPKDRILEYLAVRKLVKKMKGPILCLAGPPGVGKTSLAKSVAHALGRKFVRISLGGVRDEAEIRGHRRTYVGALPGRIIQGMRQAGSRNPVFLLDEIDKMSSDFRGDPASALLEVLDPEQNHSFSDHYIEVPFDLSDVLFITTANVVWNIPRPLLDRMELITISGYTEDEKVEIAKRHLLPKQRKDHGLSEENLEVSENVIRTIVREYTREAGVRNLERQLAALCRKAAREIATHDGVQTVRVTTQNLHTFLGAPRYQWGKKLKEDQVGVATGMVYTETGGDILPIEVSLMKGKGSLILTGKLGEVMKESAQAGLSYIRSRARDLGLEEDFHAKHDIHIHVPEGAVPKEGPSAGIAMATAVVSALTNRPVRADLAMTGEITLRGRVLPIGGVKEKLLGAHRAGITHIILPRENEKDLEEIPGNVRKKLHVHLVDHMDEVLRLALLEPREGDEQILPPPEAIDVEGTQPTSPVV